MSAFVAAVIGLAALFASDVSAQHRFDCHDEYCLKNANPCPVLECKNGRIVKNGTTCGCCDICIHRREKGEKCKTYEVGVPTHECGPQLFCDKIQEICAPAPTKCIQDLEKFRSQPHAKNLRIKKPMPECDDFGYYNPIVCIPGVLCYCVDKNGNRIFGTDLATNNATMNCNCSREFLEFPKKIPVGNFPRCLQNGNYDHLQCTEKWCYCMEGEIRTYEDVIKANTSIRDLVCYDKNSHKEDDDFFRSKCWRERESKLKKIKEYEDKGITVIGVDLPKCDLDGSYAPVQCKKNSCYCVRKNGSPYMGTEVIINSDDARNMTCRCLREKELLQHVKYKGKNMEFFSKYKCTANGNYKQKQFVDSEFFSIDEMGYQISHK